MRLVDTQSVIYKVKISSGQLHSQAVIALAHNFTCPYWLNEVTANIANTTNRVPRSALLGCMVGRGLSLAHSDPVSIRYCHFVKYYATLIVARWGFVTFNLYLRHVEFSRVRVDWWRRLSVVGRHASYVRWTDRFDCISITALHVDGCDKQAVYG